ncbi:MAG: hypothetical protein JSR77_18720 [Planctomycetes bacterium]|nr:hypothetical protein [Planctomycetota bacterium]
MTEQEASKREKAGRDPAGRRREGVPPLASKPPTDGADGSGVCHAAAASGEPCRAPARTGSDFCFIHDPAAAAEREEARREGGRERGRRTVAVDDSEPDPPLKTLQDVSGLLADTLCRVRKGTLDAKIANTVGYLAGVLIRSIEGGEFERRLEALEAAAERTVGSDSRAFSMPAPTTEDPL